MKAIHTDTCIHIARIHRGQTVTSVFALYSHRTFNIKSIRFSHPTTLHIE